MSSPLRSVFAVLDGLLLFLALEGMFYAVAFLGLGRSFDTPTPLYLSCNVVWALGAAFAGGYMAGRIAHRSAVAHGIALAVLLLPLCVFNLYEGIGSLRTPFVVALNVLVPLVCIVGAWVYAQRPRRLRRA